MSEKGPFDAAINALKTFKSGALLAGEETIELDQAIRVLEAAGEVDKQATESFLTIWHDLAGTWPPGTGRRARAVISNLRALLESLPDQPAKNAETDSATFMGMDKATELVKEKIEALPDKEKK